MLALGSFRGISYQNDFNLSNINFKTRVFYSNTARSSLLVIKLKLKSFVFTPNLL